MLDIRNAFYKVVFSSVSYCTLKTEEGVLILVHEV